MKVDFTVEEYEKVLPKYSLTIRLREIASKMSLDEKEALEGSLGNYVTGELILWDLLTSNSVQSNLASYLAANFPYAIDFDPSIIRSEKNLKDKFEEEIKLGKNVLDVLINATKSLGINLVIDFGDKLADYIKLVKSAQVKSFESATV